jgi:hypothetical protein
MSNYQPYGSDRVMHGKVFVTDPPKNHLRSDANSSLHIRVHCKSRMVKFYEQTFSLRMSSASRLTGGSIAKRAKI